MTSIVLGPQEIDAISERVAKHDWARRSLERIHHELGFDRESLLAPGARPASGRGPGTTFFELGLCSRLYNEWHREAAENMLRTNHDLRSWKFKQTIDFCMGFDFLEDLDGDLREEIVQQGLIPTGQHLLTLNRRGSNHQSTFNLALLCLHILTGRTDFLERVTSDPERSYPYQLANGVFPDGFWYEQSHASYHGGSIDRFLKMQWIGKRNGIDFGGDEVVQKMLETMPGMALPGGKIPLIGDGHAAEGQPRISSKLFELAYALYRTPWIGWMLNHFERGGLWSLLIGQDVDHVEEPVVRSQCFESAGLCVLKQGSGDAYWNGTGLGATITFGPHGDWHGHASKLGLEYVYNNNYLIRDHGHSGGYSHPIHRLWFMATHAHSTVALDGRNQAFTWSHDRPELERNETGVCHAQLFRDDVSACSVSADFAYPGCHLQRTLFLAEHYLLDIFECESLDDTEHTFDWLLHTGGILQSELPFKRGIIPEVENPPEIVRPADKGYACGDSAPLAYDYIREVELLTTAGDWKVNAMNAKWNADYWKVGEQAMQLTMLGADGTTVYKGVCPAAAKDIYDPVIVVRRRARQTTFIALHVPGERRLKLECLRQDSGTIVCRVGEEGGATDVLVKQNTREAIEVEGQKISEMLAFFKPQ